jgi:hypothetical protein
MKTSPFSKIAFGQVLLRDLTRAFLPPLPPGEGAGRRASFVRNKSWTSAISENRRVFISPPCGSQPGDAEGAPRNHTIPESPRSSPHLPISRVHSRRESLLLGDAAA